MARKSFKVKESLNIEPKASPSLTEKGDIAVDSATNKANYHNGSSASPLVTEAHASTLTNKTIDAASNTISNISNAEIKAAAAIAVNKLAAQTASRALASDGSGFITPSATTSTELGYVAGVTSAIQTQINGKQASGNYVTAITGDVTASGPGSAAATIAANAVTNAKAAQMATLTIKGNNTGSTANAIDLTVSQVQTMLGTSGSNTGDVSLGAVGSTPSANGASLSGQVLTLQPASSTLPGVVTAGTQTIGGAKTFSGAISASNLSGTNTGDQTISLTGDVTGSGVGSFAATIAANAVTNAKAAQMAAHTFKGNNTGSTANAIDLTATQLTAELNAVVGDSGSGGTKGMVPAPGSGDAAAAKFLKADGTWSTLPATVATIKKATISDQKSSGTSGGTFTSGAYRTRDLNTLSDPSSIVTSLTSNQFVLPAGTYYFEASAPGRTVNMHRCRIQNITDSTTAALGQTAQAQAGVAQTIYANAYGSVTIAGSKTFELQHYCTSTEASDGFGQSIGTGENEVYSVVVVTKLS